MSENEFDEYAGPLDIVELAAVDADARGSDEPLQDEASESDAAMRSSEASTAGDHGDTSDISDAASQPYLGRWHRLVSSTNWEKGRIISDWRTALIEAGASATEYSDEAWARRAGGVTAPHVGRLRRVFDRFGAQHQSYAGLYWSHFLAAMDWDDAPLWLEGAMRSGWSVSQMRQQRWEASGAEPDQRPRDSDLVEADVDEDVVIPAQGGGRSGKYDDQQPDGVAAGPLYEGPDFGDEAPISGQASAGDGNDPLAIDLDEPAQPQGELVQPFKNLPDLPDDLAEAVEMFKLAVLRHKAEQWRQVAAEDVVKYLVGLRVLVEARGE